MLGLDRLAQAKRLEKIEKQQERENGDQNNGHNKRPRDGNYADNNSDALARKRQYRDKRAETPSHPGGVDRYVLFPACFCYDHLSGNCFFVLSFFFLIHVWADNVYYIGRLLKEFLTEPGEKRDREIMCLQAVGIHERGTVLEIEGVGKETEREEKEMKG